MAHSETASQTSTHTESGEEARERLITKIEGVILDDDLFPVFGMFATSDEALMQRLGREGHRRILTAERTMWGKYAFKRVI